jgi:outer membrane protein
MQTYDARQKMIRWGASWLLLVGAWLLSGQSDAAVAAEALKVGVVDQRLVLGRTKAGQRALQELKEFAASRQQLMATEDQQIKQLQEELEGMSGLSEDAKQQKQRQFRARLAEYQQRAQEFNREIKGKQTELLSQFFKKVSESASVVAKKAGYAAVLDMGDEATLKIVLYHHPTIDLTDQVVKEFNRKNK